MTCLAVFRVEIHDIYVKPSKTSIFLSLLFTLSKHNFPSEVEFNGSISFNVEWT